MIKREDLVAVGKFLKPHGVKGELTLSFENAYHAGQKPEFLLCDIEGIYVPFKLTFYRQKSNVTAIVCLKNIDTPDKAKNFTGKEIFISKSEIKEKFLEEDPHDGTSLLGFTLIDSKGKVLGIVEGIDYSTINTLLRIKNDTGKEFLLPLSDEFFLSTDYSKMEAVVELPEGLLDLNL